MTFEKIKSKCDGLVLELAISKPKKAPRAVVQFSHGMAEHKERYFDFMKFLSDNGLVCVIHDHRGHGKSVKSEKDLGYFYTENYEFIVRDLYLVTEYIKEQYPKLPVYMFSHSMGTLVSRNYLKRYGDEIQKLVLCGPPTENSMAGIGMIISKLVSRTCGARKRSGFLNGLADGSFNKGFEEKNAWINSDAAAREEYNGDSLCGYIFTVNGYINLFGLLKGAYSERGWGAKNKNTDILITAGSDDPVIQSREKLEELKDFLIKKGYTNVKVKVYEGMRHEIINEKGKNTVYSDILNFLNTVNK